MAKQIGTMSTQWSYTEQKKIRFNSGHSTVNEYSLSSWSMHRSMCEYGHVQWVWWGVVHFLNKKKKIQCLEMSNKRQFCPFYTFGNLKNP